MLAEAGSEPFFSSEMRNLALNDLSYTLFLLLPLCLCRPANKNILASINGSLCTKYQFGHY